MPDYFRDPKTDTIVQRLLRNRKMSTRFSRPRRISSKSPRLNEILEHRGIVLIKIPKTGTESFKSVVWNALAGDSASPDSHFRDVLCNELTWELWPNLHMLPREPSKTPWEVGSQVFLPEQLALLESYLDGTRPMERPNQDATEKVSGGAKFRMLIGHWPWRYDPDIYRRVMVSESPVTVTLLRDPERRTVSAFFYRLRRMGSDVGAATFADFERFLREDYNPDYYCSWFSWPDAPESANYANARKNLASEIDIVGTTERYADFLRVCQRELGIESTPVHENKTSGAAFCLDDLPGEIRKLLQQVTQKDRDLYEIARGRMEAAIASG